MSKAASEYQPTTNSFIILKESTLLHKRELKPHFPGGN